MKSFALFCLGLLLISGVAAAQNADPLTITLPNGRELHFQTPEQKARFEAARQRQSSLTAAAQPAPAATSAPSRAKLGSSLDAPDNSGTGIVNTSAPPFTAHYYLMAPASWVGKKVTLAVAYLQPQNDVTRADGLTQMSASTWNSSVTLGGDQNSGGSIPVLASGKVATRLMQQCGTTLQWMSGWHVKVTMIHGEIRQIKQTDGTEGNGYGLYVAE